jgi:hypothetical protein
MTAATIIQYLCYIIGSVFFFAGFMLGLAIFLEGK